MDDLKRCVELGGLLLQPGKEVEDDTLLDRILSEAVELLHGTSTTTCMVHCIEGLLAVLSDHIGKLSIHHTVSAHGYLIRLASHLISAAPGCSKFQSIATILLSFPVSHLKEKRCEECYSLASSWLSAIKNISHIWEYVADLPEADQAYLDIISMAYSRSLFVRRQAIECLAMVLIKLHEINRDVQEIYKKFSLRYNGPTLHSLLDLSHVILKLSYSNGIEILASLEICVASSVNKHELSELCSHCEPVLCHFIESLYCDKYRRCDQDIIGKVITPAETMWCAMNCISHHPTKAVGWKILLALITYGPASQERDVATSLVTSCTQSWEYGTIIENNSLEYVLNCCNVLISHKNNIPVMGRVLCHVLNAIGTLVGNTPPELINSLTYLVRTISSSNNIDHSHHEVMARLFVENNNTTVALLGCLQRTCNGFSANEKEDMYQFVLALMAKPSTHHAVVQSCHNVAKCLLQHSYNKDFLAECVRVTTGFFTDRRWEVKDSALQFFSTLLSASVHDARADLIILCAKYSVLSECMKLIDDGNAFVRAAALTLLGHLISAQQICYGDYDTVLEIILKTMNDTDIFPRRKAVTVFVDYLKNNDEFLSLLHKVETIDSSLHMDSQKLLKAAQNAIYQTLFEDLDWEVKYNSLGILQLLLEKDLQHNTSPSSQLVSMMHKMENDYDNAVKEKSKVIAISFGISSRSSVSFESKSELHSLLAEALTSLKDSTNNDPALLHQEISVILDCY